MDFLWKARISASFFSCRAWCCAQLSRPDGCILRQNMVPQKLRRGMNLEPDFQSKVFFVVGVLILALLLCAALFYAPEFFLLIFAGILVSVFLRGISGFFCRHTGIGYGWSLGIVIVILGGICAFTGYFAGPSVAEQFDQLTTKIPEAVESVRTRMEAYTWGQSLVEEARPGRVLKKSPALMGIVRDLFTSALGWFANLAIILFIGLYIAVEPSVYRRGFFHLVPKNRRARLSAVMTELDETLKWWLIGKFFGMAVIGLFTALGLWLLGVPLALILGLIAALLTFIPNIGPVLAAIPAVLLALTVGLDRALYVALLYIGIQAVESYLLTPLVQRKTIELPPALTLSAQVLLGMGLGALGVALATPLTAVGLVVSKMLYVEDGLGDKEAGKAE